MVERKWHPPPVVRSTEGAATRPSRLRFVNNFSYPIDIFWLDHEGHEKFYVTIPVSEQYPQATYTTHAWRIRETETKRLLGTYVGEEATIEMTKASACLVHKGFSSGYALSKRKQPAQWGTFRQRGEAKGIPIRAYDCVSEKAVARAEHIVTKMVEHMPKGTLNRLHQSAADIAIIGRHQVTSDMPMHSFLKGKNAEQGQNQPQRSWDGCRGCGGSWTVPTCSAGEENLLMQGDKWHPSENILVHEFAHSVMAIGMNEDQRQAVLGAYFNARANSLYKMDCYMMASADEYWAEGAQSWFEATIRTDVNDRINTRSRVKRHDPQLAKILEIAFGDGDWRYHHTCPAKLSFSSQPVQSYPSKDQLARLHSRAARYSACCAPSLPYSFSGIGSYLGLWTEEKAEGKAT